MSIHAALHHKTEYTYDRPILLGPQVVRLRPAYHARTPIVSYGLNVEPADHFVNWQQDPFGNPLARFVFEKPVRKLSITVELIADMTVINPFDFFISEEYDCWPFQYEKSLKAQLAPYLILGDSCDALRQWLEKMPKSAERMVDFLVEVNQHFFREIDYLVRMEPGVQTPQETLTLRSGSCRDTAWLMVETFRQLGMAARFVSGYLIQLTADEKPLDGPSGPEADFCDLHAWTEVYVPGAGWIGLDPTSGLFAGEGHIPLACSPDFSDAAPITGAHEKCEVEFHHEMSVRRAHEDPRVTKPYNEQQWSRIMQLGEQIDSRLETQDVRLTMGGEPTFVSIDNVDDPQWSTDAVGAEKRVLSNLLLLRLRDEFAPGGLLHYGQGKWYPGESLPRYALTCLWRVDGDPIWDDPKFLADEGRDYGHTVADAKRFVRHLARELQISAKMTFPVFEDTFHYLWREGRLPLDVDPRDPKLKDPNERAMMIRTFQEGLGCEAGYVLPLRRAWWQTRPGWLSGRWPVRNEQVFLLPGDSPIGLRLPLDSLPVAAASGQAIYTSPVDPTMQRGALPTREQVAPGRQLEESYAINEQVMDEEDDDDLPTNEDVIHTALCVQARHGRLHVFMPPMQRAEDYLELVSALEDTSRSLNLPVVIEGYLPPPDPRLEYFKVTPDPGVIEVNTQPSAQWSELVERTKTLYEQAKLCRLGTEKFDLDGRHTGTGGGNHIVLGGKAPLESPFLRRPDLLASMIAFWNNHPSLTYLFSGRFVGPTSQAPRFDENRGDAIHEMEIALQNLPPAGQSSPPWLVDRLFRDLLVDLSGNTHRSEICIDKLYSPDSSTGRLGLVELRGFEMPPHAEMSLTQQLLIRGLVAYFWQHPYRQPLADWKNTLHDRFMLPHFVWTDFMDVCRELADHDMSFSPAWFETHFDFRFPMIGTVTHHGVTLKLRSAIEPWNVLGEEPGGGGTARYVDSSLERLEILAEGLDPTRYAIVCNGIEVPMTATATESQYVAGVRYRAWQPPRCLHPTIGIHSPLRFELVDRSVGRSIGGCTYHVVHPGGRGTDRFPVNANEAESRRVARFDDSTLSDADFSLLQKLPRPGSNSLPVTLDLRRHS